MWSASSPPRYAAYFQTTVTSFDAYLELAERKLQIIIKEWDLIQNVIRQEISLKARMRALAMTAFSAICAISIHQQNNILPLAAMPIALIFWYVDFSRSHFMSCRVAKAPSRPWRPQLDQQYAKRSLHDGLSEGPTGERTVSPGAHPFGRRQLFGNGRLQDWKRSPQLGGQETPGSFEMHHPTERPST